MRKKSIILLMTRAIKRKNSFNLSKPADKLKKTNKVLIRKRATT
jgi:hypothetical protein